MSRTVVHALRAPIAALMLVGSAAVAAPASADNGFILISSTPVVEGNSGQTAVVFTAGLSSVSSTPVTAHFFTSQLHTTLLPGDATPGTACGGTVDYISVSQTITIPANANPPQVTVSVPVCGDTRAEGNESFMGGLNDVQGSFCLELCGAMGTILDDGDTVPGLSVANASQREGNGTALIPAREPMSFAVSLSAASASTVTVNYDATVDTHATPGNQAIGGETCTRGVDYIDRPGTLTFNPGETQKTIGVPLCGDTVNESLKESFLMRLSSPSNATIDDGTGSGIIIDDD